MFAELFHKNGYGRRIRTVASSAGLRRIGGRLWTALAGYGHGPVVAASAPVNTTPPTIAGNAAVGSVLTVTPGVWTGNPTPRLTYEWMVGNAPISGAYSPTYTVQAGAAGNDIKIREIATNSAGVHSVFSNVIAIP